MFQSDRPVKSRKPHLCEACRRTIPAGVTHTYIAGKYDGDFYTSRQHEDCRQLWHKCFENWGDWSEGMPYNLAEVFSDSGDPDAARAEFDAWRGQFPHAVTRMEFTLRGWLEGGDT